MSRLWEEQYNNILNSITTSQMMGSNSNSIFSTAKQASPPVATILSKDMKDFFTKRDDLLKDIFLDKLAGDMTKWKFANGSANSTHQVVIKGPKGWSIVGNQNEGQLMHDSKVIYRATSSEYQALKPMAVSVVQVIQKAMDSEIERLKTSLVEDLDVEETYDNATLPSFLRDASAGQMDPTYYANMKSQLINV